MKTTMIRKGLRGGLIAVALTGTLFGVALAQQNARIAGKTPGNQPTSKGKPAMSQQVGYDDTPFLPGNQWRVHDSKRPQPTVVTPPPAGAAVPAPSDAVVLFDGTNLDGWKQGNGDPCKWKLVDGAMEVVRGAGNITRQQATGNRGVLGIGCWVLREEVFPAPNKERIGETAEEKHLGTENENLSPQHPTPNAQYPPVACCLLTNPIVG